MLFHAVPRRGASLEWVDHRRDLPVRFCIPSGSCLGGGDLHGLYLPLSQGCMLVVDIPLVVCGLCFEKVGGVVLPGWPCPGVSLDGATVSPDPSCLSLQYLCCSGLCQSVISGVFLLSYRVSCVNLSMLP